MSNTPLKDAMEAGIKCVGQTNPGTGKHESIVPTQEMVDDEAANLSTPEDIFNTKVKSMTNAVQAHLDTTAQAWGYDNIISLCTYDGNSDLKYSAEGAAGKEWRSSVWRYCEDELIKIATGTRPEPESDEVFIAELPTIARPKV